MLIPKVNYDDFVALSPEQIKQLQSCAVTSDEEVIFFAVISSDIGGGAIKDDISTRAEYLAARMNSVGGKTIDELTAPVVIPTEPELIKPPTRKPANHRKK